MTISSPEYFLSRWTTLSDLRAAVARGAPVLEASGLWGVSRALVAAALVASTRRPLLMLVPGAAERHRTALDLGYFLSTWPSSSEDGDAPSPARVLEFPPEESGSWRGRHREQAAEHALCCHRLLQGDAPSIVTTPSALDGATPHAGGVPGAHDSSGRRRQRPARGPARAARLGGIRARRDGCRSRTVELARRHRRYLLAREPRARPGRVLRGRGRIPASLRSDQPAVGGRRVGLRRDPIAGEGSSRRAP